LTTSGCIPAAESEIAETLFRPRGGGEKLEAIMDEDEDKVD